MNGGWTFLFIYDSSLIRKNHRQSRDLSKLKVKIMFMFTICSKLIQATLCKF